MKITIRTCERCITQLAKMSIDPKFDELTAETLLEQFDKIVACGMNSQHFVLPFYNHIIMIFVPPTKI